MLPGEAEVCCHESEKTGDLELEKLLSLLHFHIFCPILQKSPGFSFAESLGYLTACGAAAEAAAPCALRCKTKKIADFPALTGKTFDTRGVSW